MVNSSSPKVCKRTIAIVQNSQQLTLQSTVVEIWSLHACTMHPGIIIGTVRSLWTWLWGRYHVPQNVFLVITCIVVVFRQFRLLYISQLFYLKSHNICGVWTDFPQTTRKNNMLKWAIMLFICTTKTITGSPVFWS